MTHRVEQPEILMPESWSVLAWKTSGGYGSQGSQGSQGSLNASKERIWFSPHCLPEFVDRRDELPLEAAQ